jgi:CheY-like chemotaxis protein
MMCEVLSERGFEVEVARSPERVPELVRRASSRIDLIVAAMPRPNPAPDRFAESMRGGFTGPPVLALADAGPAPIESLDPRVRVLRKPVSRAELREALDPWPALAAEG